MKFLKRTINSALRNNLILIAIICMNLYHIKLHQQSVRLIEKWELK